MEDCSKWPWEFFLAKKLFCCNFWFILVKYALFLQAYAELLEEEDIKIPAWFSFNSKDGVNVVSGDSILECASIAESCRKVVAVGINCTPPRFIDGMILAIKGVWFLIFCWYYQSTRIFILFSSSLYWYVVNFKDSCWLLIVKELHVCFLFYFLHCKGICYSNVWICGTLICGKFTSWMMSSGDY